ncbi:LuxR C-terminal-related transcriptional regulator [Janthinobacterium lividum]|uniref:LuxR C-terminal-related transcriptional regulator n=1 Tax=Janthinobacterium lividum TaxID=29581 RepID=UPI0008735584|nr:response regulator transcription factor [Janthinobacterium lividum]OEZ58678.1 transcriptional regulatory protein DegU [Janthinobacterium lividum]WQE30708.1 response regulator transcription factor [Janthinobacterium lividum]STQ96213.1 Response regulator protein vraR [Janthinobacterium lividum]
MSTNNVIRVMLVSDHKTWLWGLEQLLAGAQPAMQVVASSTEIDSALLLARTLCPDVIVLDADLGCGGACAIDYLPQLLGNGVSRVLLFSGTQDQAECGRAVRSGARAVLGKETSIKQLIDAIARLHQGELCLDPALLDSMLGVLNKPEAAPDPEEQRIARLTLKERKIVAMMVEGNGALNRAIAQRAFISEQTLRNHLTSIYSKLDVTNRLELYVYATRNRLAEPVHAE